MASPKTLCEVGLPRRRSSLSMAGRSSWIRLYVWIISTAQASAISASSAPPTASPAARTRMGRMRLPPAKRL
jgi:hypothetical protein